MRVRLAAAILALAASAPIFGAAIARDSGFDFELTEPSKAMPELRFRDVEGNDLTLDDFAGRYVLLNVWATWCPPCREELPTLEGLQRALGGDRFQVIALSTDTGRMADVEDLYRELGLDGSGVFVDSTGAAMGNLAVFGLPTTLLIDGQGREVARKFGPAVWDSPDAVAFFCARIAGSGATAPEACPE